MAWYLVKHRENFTFYTKCPYSHVPTSRLTRKETIHAVKKVMQLG
jgi:hypothetical protein